MEPIGSVLLSFFSFVLVEADFGLGFVGVVLGVEALGEGAELVGWGGDG